MFRLINRGIIKRTPLFRFGSKKNKNEQQSQSEQEAEPQIDLTKVDYDYRQMRRNDSNQQYGPDTGSTEDYSTTTQSDFEETIPNYTEERTVFDELHDELIKSGNTEYQEFLMKDYARRIRQIEKDEFKFEIVERQTDSQDSDATTVDQDADEFKQFKQQIQPLRLQREVERQEENITIYEILKDPYRKKTAKAEQYKIQNQQKNRVSFFIDNNVDSYKLRRADKKKIKSVLQAQIHTQLLSDLVTNSGKEDQVIQQFINRIKGKESQYINTLSEGYQLALVNCKRIGQIKNILDSLSSLRTKIQPTKYTEVTNFVVRGLSNHVENNYSELGAQKIKLLLPLINISQNISQIFELFSKNQNTNALRYLAENYRQHFQSLNVDDSCYSRFLVSCYSQKPINEIIDLALLRNPSSDFESFRAEIFKLKVIDKKVCNLTVEQALTQYHKICSQNNGVHTYALYILLQICQLNHCHQLVFHAYKQIPQQFFKVPADLQRFYHDSILALPIVNLQQIASDLIRNQDYHLLFSLKCLTKVGFNEETFTIFKEKVLDDIIPTVMTERIRKFFQILLTDFQSHSGCETSKIMEEVTKFCETIKNHPNYLIGLYNKENIYSIRMQKKMGFFRTLFQEHPKLRNLEFTEQQALMLYGLICDQLSQYEYQKFELEHRQQMFDMLVSEKIDDFLPVKEYMDQVSEFDLKKQFEMYLLQLNIYLQRLRLSFDAVDDQELQAFQQTANPYVRFVLESYGLIPLAECEVMDADQMLLAIDQVRNNNYWVKKSTLQQRYLDPFKSQILEVIENLVDKNNQHQQQLQERLDERENLDLENVFSKQQIVMQKGEYQPIDRVDRIYNRQIVFFTQEQEDIHRENARIQQELQNQQSLLTEPQQDQNLEGQQAVDDTQNLQAEEAVAQDNAQQAANENVQESETQNLEQGANENVEEGLVVAEEYPQEYQNYESEEQFIDYEGIKNKKMQAVTELAAILKTSSHYKNMIEQVRRPITQHQVNNFIEARNVFGQDAHLGLTHDVSYHSRRFDDDDGELGLYEKKIDLGVVKPQTYVEINQQVDKYATLMRFLNKQDLEHIDEFPDETEDVEQVIDDFANYDMIMSQIDEQAQEILQETLKPRVALRNIYPIQGFSIQDGSTFSLVDGQTESGVEAQQQENAYQEGEEAQQQAEENQVVLEAEQPQQEGVQLEAQEGVAEEAQQEVAEMGQEEAQQEEVQQQEGQQEGQQYAQQGEQLNLEDYGRDEKVESNQSYSSKLRKQFVRMVEVHKMWQNPLVQKHQYLNQFTNEMAKDQNTIDIKQFQQLKERFPHFWQMSQRYIVVEKDPFVEELIAWGINNEEPLAIYMGEKLAMLTGQKIPDHYAQNISKLLDVHAQTSVQLRKKCREALRFVGKISRDNIYDFNKCYKHIISNRSFQQYLSTIEEVNNFQNKNTILRHQVRNPSQFAAGKISDTEAWKSIERKAALKKIDYM